MMSVFKARRYLQRAVKGVAILAVSPMLMAATLHYEDVIEEEHFVPLAGNDTAPAPRLRLAALGPPIDDEELGGMRGKFIGPEAVSYFGISLLTSWQDGSGITTVARLAFNVDFLIPSEGGSPVPRLYIDWVREGDPDMDVAGVQDGYVALATGPDQVIPVGALDTVSGAAQVNVIAGADNHIGNGMQIAVVPRSAMAPFATDGLQPTTETLNLAFQDGDELQFRLGDNELGLVLTGQNGLDSTMQSIGGGLGRVLQQSILNSDHNTVMNHATIVFGVDDTIGKLEKIGVSGAMSMLKGSGF